MVLGFFFLFYFERIRQDVGFFSFQLVLLVVSSRLTDIVASPIPESRNEQPGTDIVTSPQFLVKFTARFQVRYPLSWRVAKIVNSSSLSLRSGRTSTLC
jgi:hypothetical protein